MQREAWEFEVMFLSFKGISAAQQRKTLAGTTTAALSLLQESTLHHSLDAMGRYEGMVCTE